MIDGADIIHMNGRIYDSHLARFVQADPIIQAPEVLGSLNRYSYVWNNPLNMTDPSGYMGCRVPPDMQRAMPIYDVYSESSSGYDVTLTYDDGSPQTFFLSDSFVDSATGEVDQGWADAVVDASGGRFGRNVTGYFNEQGEPLLASDNGPSGNLVEDPTLKSALEVVEGEVAHKGVSTNLLSFFQDEAFHKEFAEQYPFEYSKWLEFASSYEISAFNAANFGGEIRQLAWLEFNDHITDVSMTVHLKGIAGSFSGHVIPGPLNKAEVWHIKDIYDGVGKISSNQVLMETSLIIAKGPQYFNENLFRSYYGSGFDSRLTGIYKETRK